METSLKAIVTALFATLHTIIFTRTNPDTGETYDDKQLVALIMSTFADVRIKYTAAKDAADKEDADVKTKREAANKAANAKFMALLENALKGDKPASWAVSYREMMATAHPAGGDKKALSEIVTLHDDMITVLSLMGKVNPTFAGIDTRIPKLQTKGRPAGSKNKAKAETPSA
jgi:hypothetical protein